MAKKRGCLIPIQRVTRLKATISNMKKDGVEEEKIKEYEEHLRLAESQVERETFVFKGEN